VKSVNFASPEVTFNVAVNFFCLKISQVTELFFTASEPNEKSTLAFNLLFVAASATGATSSLSTTGASAVSSENVSAAGASVATAASVPSLNSAAHTGTLEVASIATTSDILNVFFAMPFFVFLIFVMIIVPLWVVDRLILEKISYGELISDLRNIWIL